MAKILNKAAKPVLVGGVKLRSARAQEAFVELADASGETLIAPVALPNIGPSSQANRITWLI